MKTFYAYKNHLYYIVNKVRMKDSTKGWVDAIQYKRADIVSDSNDSQIFVRDEEDFKLKMTPIQTASLILQDPENGESSNH